MSPVMVFWIISVVLACAVLAILLMPLRRVTAEEDDPSVYDIAVYRDQLAEVDRDLARGVITDEVAERTRLEVSRRILEADKSADQAHLARAPRLASLGLALVAVFFVIGGSLWLYWIMGAPGYGDQPLEARLAASQELRDSRPDQVAAEAAAGALAPPPVTPDADYAELMTRLRATLSERPNDLRGFELLAQNEANLGNFSAAHQAKARVILLKGETASATDYADLADMLVLAAGGYVSPEAEDAIGEAIARDPANGPARYYQGLLFFQTGRPDLAFGIWRRLLNASAPDAPWVPAIRAQIEEAAFRAGEVYELPPEVAVPALRGPSREDMDAAAEMSLEDRMGMIEGMVEGLSARLASQGGRPDEWAQLITALGVLGQTDRASAIYQESLVVFAASPGALDTLRAAAEQAGIGP